METEEGTATSAAAWPWPQNNEGSKFYPDEDWENVAEDDEGSIYNPAVELTQ